MGDFLKNKIIVIGAGASGLMAAGQALLNPNNEVTIIEKNNTVGKKMLITGKGRCNVTNYCDNDTFISSVVSNARFMYGPINCFSCYDTYSFFEEIGVPLKIERGNRVFPKSDKAEDIVNALYKYVKSKGCKFITGEVISIDIKDEKITGLELSDAKKISCDYVIIATGGKSYPKTGSTGTGYRLAEQAGHTIIPLQPSLVPLESKDKSCKKLQGLSLKNVSIKLVDGKSDIIYEDFGEMLFTHFGVSGPIILSASSHIDNINDTSYKLEIDLKPALSYEKLDARILREFNELCNKDFVNMLHKLLPNKLIPVIIKRVSIPSDKKCNSITKDEREKLINVLKHFIISIDNFRPIEEAIITRGGVSVKEVSPKTMESKLVKGLYFAGEVLDLDAYTGGFNLQIAFSTGYVAGKSID